MFVTNSLPIASMQRINSETCNIVNDKTIRDIAESRALVLEEMRNIYLRTLSSEGEIVNLIGEIKLWERAEVDFTMTENLRFCLDMIPILEKAAEQIVIDRKEIEENMNTIIDLSEKLKERHITIVELADKMKRTDRSALEMINRREKYADIGRAYINSRKLIGKLHSNMEEQKIQIEAYNKQLAHFKLKIDNLSDKLDKIGKRCASLWMKTEAKDRASINCTIL